MRGVVKLWGMDAATGRTEELMKKDSRPLCFFTDYAAARLLTWFGSRCGISRFDIAIEFSCQYDLLSILESKFA